MSEYENVTKGSLKLKGVSSHTIKKKKKKKEKEKDQKRMLESIGSSSSIEEERGGASFVVDKRTTAEKAFEKARDKRRLEMILEKAGKTHKDRITEFNRKLDNMSEHFDIPKVSWTK